MKYVIMNKNGKLRTIEEKWSMSTKHVKWFFHHYEAICEIKKIYENEENCEVSNLEVICEDELI